MSSPTTTGTRTDSAGRVTLINQKDRIGIAVLVLGFLGGLWLIVAPFLVDYQARGSDWANGTINEVAIGAGVAVLSLATIIWFVAGTLHELGRTANTTQQGADDPTD